MNKISEQKKLFKDLEIGAEFRQAKYIDRHGVACYLIFEKVSKSAGKVLQCIPESYAPRLVDGIFKIGANGIVWEYISEPMTDLEFHTMLSQGKR